MAMDFTEGKIVPIALEEEMRRSYLNFAMYVIVDRALPDVRDGLKPVQRRILNTMLEIGLRPDRPFKKSARVVGETMAKYHPHGDAAIYDAMVRMGQEFSYRYMLVQGHGNFGCFTGDTKIKLVDGTEKSFQELSKLGPEGRFYVYSYDRTNRRIVVAEGRNSRITRRNAQLIELTLDTGEKIKCTPDHRFLLKSGEYKQAQHLTPEDSLAAGYFSTAPVREGTNDYLRVLQPNGEWSFVHHLADEYNERIGRARPNSEHVNPRFETAITYFDSLEEMIERAEQYNHRVVAIRWLTKREDVYDITVDTYHNFLLSSGVFVHNSIDGDPPAAMRYCVTGDTLVVTDQGLQRIDQLSPSQSEDIDTTVLSIGGEQNKANKWFDCGAFPTFRVTTRAGYDVIGTENHPLLCCVRDKFGRPVLVWKTIAEIKPGDWLVLDRSSDMWPGESVDVSHLHPLYPESSRVQRHRLPDRLDERLAFVLGALTAEATVRENVIEFANTEGAFATSFQKAWAEAFPTCRLRTFSRQAVGYGRQPFLQMQVVSPQVVQFLQDLGLGGDFGEREIPAAIMQSPKPVVAAFLRALFEGDGTVERSGKSLLRVGFSSKSKTLIRTLQTLLLRFGIVSSRRWDGRSGNYRLLIASRNNLQKFADEIGFVSDEKRNALADAISKRTGKGLSRTAQVMPLEDAEWISGVAQGRYYFDQVTNIEDAGEQNVYSVRVDSECHSFVANGFVNHNTEARLSRLAMEMLRDLDKDTVDYGPNFDDSLEQPLVLPARFPNLLVNGATGIAVGMSTNIPPHNLTEVINALVEMIDNPEVTVDQLMKHIKGPDFPTGGLILGRDGIREAYRTGRGRIRMRAKVRIEQMQGGRHRILVTEIPYMVNKASLVEKIAELHNEKKVDGITALRDESDRKGMRIVIELRRDVNPNIVLNQLYKHSPLQETFGVIMLALVNGEPKILDLKGMLYHYLEHQREVVTRRTKFELRKAEDRAHILEGYRIALDHIDEIIQLIRNAESDQDAKVKLMQRFGLSERQAVAILDMQLRRLTGLEREKIESEYQELLKTIAYLKEILGDEQKLFGLIKDELSEIRDKYGDERRTEITSAEGDGDLDIEDLIADEDIVVTLTHHGYVKRLPLTSYRSQKRGGRGVTALSTRSEDFVEHLFITSTHTYIVFFTNKGRVYRLKAHEIPEAGRNARGTAIINLIPIEPGERIQAAIPIREYDDDRYLFIATRNGIVKKTVLSEFDSSYSGLIALTLDEDDEVIGVQLTDGNQDMLLVTGEGQAIRFHEGDVRPMGRTARGVRGITLDEGDAVVGMDVVHPDRELLVVTANGFGKRTPLSEYRITGRGGKGIRTIQRTDRNGPITGIKVVREDDDVMLISLEGIMIRFSVNDVSRLGRSTQGVRLMRLGENDRVVALAKVVSRDEENDDDDYQAPLDI